MSKAIQDVGAPVGACPTCDRPLPLSECRGGEQPRLWVCGCCDAVIQAALAANYDVDELRNLRPARITIRRDELQPAPAEMLQFARNIEAADLNSIEKRTAPRHSMIAVLPTLELDRRLEACGNPFLVTCRNISTGGICLLNQRAVVSDFLAVEFTAQETERIQILVRVLRRRPHGPYHEIGCEFITRFA